MKKLPRKKLVLEKLEKLLQKCERRIQAISLEAYQIRTYMEQIQALPVQKPFVKAEEVEEKKDEASKE